jgi:hypothetical protein
MALANVIDFLDKHQGASTAILTGALVLVTVIYAWQNRKMVREMKHARDAAILPKLALEFHRLGPNVVDLAIRNVGPGAAIDIDVRTEWVPIAEDATAPGARWRRNLLSPSEQVELFPPGDLGGNLDSLPDRFREVRLQGTMIDAAGTTHEVDERFSDLPEWRRILGDAHESWHPPEPERRAADAFYKKFERPLKDLTNATNEVARAVRASTPPPTSDGD